MFFYSVQYAKYQLHNQKKKKNIMVNEEDTVFVSLLPKAKLLSHSTSLSKNDLKPFSSHDGRLLS